MRIEIKGLAEWRQRLEQVRPAEILAQALAEQAQALADAVKDRLSEPQGAGSHDTPWVRTGALRDSIAATASGLEAAIGSNDPAAAPQEMGTSRIPPRPFLAPAAAASGEGIARAVGASLAAALKSDASPSSSPSDSQTSPAGVSSAGTAQASPPRVANTGATSRST